MRDVNPKLMYKFGRTNSEDILERYDPEIHVQRGWRNIPLGRDYNVKVLWSMWVSKERAVKAEEWFKKTYPKRFFALAPYNGITECRNWSQEESYYFTSLLDKYYPKTPEYWREIATLRKEGNLQKYHDKVYFIMLTRKNK
jgi:hypothetical protein